MKKIRVGWIEENQYEAIIEVEDALDPSDDDAVAEILGDGDYATFKNMCDGKIGTILSASEVKE